MIGQELASNRSPHTYDSGIWAYWSDISKRVCPLPGWATYFLILGEAIARLPNSEGHSLTALSVPTSRFAAALTVTGYLLGSDAGVSLEQHITSLRSLPLGRQVWINTATKRIKGNFNGIVQSAEGERVCVEVKRGKQPYYHTLPLSLAAQIQIASDNIPTKRARHVEKVKRTPFAAAALKSTGNPRFWMQSSIEAVIVGQKNRLREEITDSLFSIQADNSQTSGSLQEIVRTKDFAERGDPLGFATVVEIPNEQSTQGSDKPGLVVFDGPRSFLRAKSRYSQARNWVVVLDRTNRRFADAASMIDDLFIERDGNIGSSELPTPPVGIEVTHFKRG